MADNHRRFLQMHFTNWKIPPHKLYKYVHVNFEVWFASVTQHCFRYWLGTWQVPSHYLKQWWPKLLMSASIMSKQINSRWPSDIIWHYRSGSTLAHVICFMAWHHQAITWTNIDLSLVRVCSIHLRAILLPVPKLLFCIKILKIILFKLLPHLPGASELICDRCEAASLNFRET